MESDNQKFLGKKIFFLYPHSVIHNELLMEIIKNEYEVYILKDHNKALKLIEKYNDSILFINIDTELKETEWEKYVISIMNNPNTKNVKIGIVSYNDNDSLIIKYLMEIGVPCGYIKLKIGFEESKKIILKVLEANEVKGIRKYVRAEFSENSSSTTSFNVKINNTLFSGWIKDISSVGMACIFTNAISLNIKLNTYLNDIQLRLKGQICMVSGQIAGIRQDKDDIYVVMFDKDLKEEEKNKIHNFIYTSLQHMMDQEMNGIKLEIQHKKIEKEENPKK